MSPINSLTKELAQLDPDDFRFHAARYESGRLFRNAIQVAQEGRFPNIEILEALDATASDGGVHGCLPCVTDEVQELFDRACNFAV